MKFLNIKNKQNEKRILYGLIFIFLVLFFYNIFSTIKYLEFDKYNNIGKIGNEYFIFDQASTPAEQELGLSFRKDMCARCGMIFEFEEEGTFPFWMKDMNFDLDMIYVDQNKKVIEIFENFQKETYPESFANKNLAKYIIELNAGAVQRYGIKLGDMLDY